MSQLNKTHEDNGRSLNQEDGSVLRLDCREIIDGDDHRGLVESIFGDDDVPAAFSAESDEACCVELDFADVNSLSSAGIGDLIKVNREARGLDVSLVLVNVSESVRDIFSVTRLDRLFTLPDSENVGQASV